jgi:hypothetical protein
MSCVLLDVFVLLRNYLNCVVARAPPAARPTERPSGWLRRCLLFAFKNRSSSRAVCHCLLKISAQIIITDGPFNAWLMDQKTWTHNGHVTAREPPTPSVTPHRDEYKFKCQIIFVPTGIYTFSAHDFSCLAGCVCHWFMCARARSPHSSQVPLSATALDI